jgi:hypothetical protein
MIRPGLFMWIFKDDTTIYIRFLHLFGLGIENVNEKVGNGFRILIGLWRFEFGFHILKRRGNYVERVENEKSTQASA